ncbi:MAG: Lrp/AsnC family transcriptional regulator [Bacteroidales bacterium]|nr:Lrp/AsnC family transcriptional regulator [Bacteroidales bacterium]HPD95171.1 Lrp/AsnC family transcriptional regulator [Tenuifilaceae bacterium]HRX32414.1 Lrp/AsnC family transcriptional regulator [Tenuifilaceae bacterium]
MRNIDEIDRKLLNILQENSRVTIRELSERLHLSTTPIHERIKKLERNGIIKNYITLLNPSVLGKKLTVFISVSLSSHTKDDVDEFEHQVNKMPEVMECYYVSGTWDFLLKVQCNDMEDYHNFVIHSFSILKNITQFYSSFVMSESKVSHKYEL